MSALLVQSLHSMQTRLYGTVKCSIFMIQCSPVFIYFNTVPASAFQYIQQYLNHVLDYNADQRPKEHADNVISYILLYPTYISHYYHRLIWLLLLAIHTSVYPEQAVPVS